MVKIFRKLRQQLMAGNTFGKYLFYAIGEIILVVLGILIALQINTWNEQRKENNLEHSYYCKLLEDVEQDISQVQEQIVKTDERLRASNEMLRLLQLPAPRVDQVMQQTLAAISLITYTFRPNMAAYEDLKSSGNLKILRDNPVKKEIIEYYSMLDGMIDVVDINADGAVSLFQAKEDFADVGWQYLDFVRRGIDTSKVHFDALISSSFNPENFRKRMTSDAVFYVGSNSRIKYLYETVLPDMEEMQQLLAKKCR